MMREKPIKVSCLEGLPFISFASQRETGYWTHFALTASNIDELVADLLKAKKAIYDGRVKM